MGNWSFLLYKILPLAQKLTPQYEVYCPRLSLLKPVVTSVSQANTLDNFKSAGFHFQLSGFNVISLPRGKKHLGKSSASYRSNHKTMATLMNLVKVRVHYLLSPFAKQSILIKIRYPRVPSDVKKHSSFQSQ